MEHMISRMLTSVLESVGGSFDTEAFDLAAVNRALIALLVTRRAVQ